MFTSQKEQSFQDIIALLANFKQHCASDGNSSSQLSASCKNIVKKVGDSRPVGLLMNPSDTRTRTEHSEIRRRKFMQLRSRKVFNEG